MKLKKLVSRSLQILLAGMIAGLAVYPGSSAVQAEEPVYDGIKTEGQNQQSEIYTWRLIKSSSELEHIVETYQDLYGGDGTIPIMLIACKGNERYVIGSPGGDGSYGNTNISSKMDYTTMLSNSNNSYNGLVLDKNNSVYTDSAKHTIFMTRGAYNPFYLEYSPKEESGTEGVEFGVKPLVHDYVLHTYKVEDGKYSASDYVLEYGLGKGNDIGYSVNMGYSLLDSNERVYRDNLHSIPRNRWSITDGSSAYTFRIWNSYWDKGLPEEGGTTQYRRVALLSYGSFFGSHEFCVNVTLEGTAVIFNRGVRSETVNGNSLYYLDMKMAGQKVSEYMGINEFQIWYGVPGTVKGMLNRETESTGYSVHIGEYTELVSSTSISGSSRTIKSGETYAIPDYTSFVIKNGQSLIIEKGGTLIVGRSAYLVNNGLIQNEGQIIVQPGALIDYLDAQVDSVESFAGSAVKDDDITPSWMAENVNAPRIAGSGNLLVRKGGRVKTAYLLLEGDLNNSGVIIVTKIAARPDNVVMNNAKFYRGYEGPPNLVLYPADQLGDILIHGSGTANSFKDMGLTTKYTTFSKVSYREAFSGGKSTIMDNTYPYE